MILIDRTDIELWGTKHDAKGNFPKLLAKLIWETSPKSTVLRMPSGSAVNLPGWDGVVDCEIKVGNVPEGKSFWEIGTNGNESKANQDYEKRSTEDIGVDKKLYTYVFVTTRYWENKDKWAQAKAAQGIWKEVIAYDSIDITEWLGNAQISCRWFSILAQNHPSDGVYTADEYWKMISIGPKGQLPPEVIISGREREVTALYDFLRGQPAVKAVRGSTKDEAIGFIIAAASQYDRQTKESFFSRSLVVEDEKSFHSLRMNKNAINLITKMDKTATLYVAALHNGHHVIVALGPDDDFGSQDVITLPRVDGDGQVRGLITMGLSQEEAYKYSKEAGRDYTILKSLLGFPPDKTKWKYQDRIRELVPALLVGRWDESKLGDRAIIETLAGETYDTYAQKLQNWLDVESPPLIKIGNNWRLTSPLDAWTYVSQHISEKDLENFQICFFEAMLEIDPALKIAPHNRVLASMQGLVYKHSAWCREGLTQTTILIGLYGDKLKLLGNSIGQQWVDKLIANVLSDAPGELWVSRNIDMPLIAEASPKSFFESVKQSLSSVDRPIMYMFVEEDGLATPTSNHTGLLWALESLAWMEDYVLEASIILAKLSALDPGGRLANRPINSLREIYKTWHYQTLAAFDVRMKILERIIKTEQKIGWLLLTGMISKGPSTATPTHKLRWRLFNRSIDNDYHWPEVFSTQSHIITLLIKYFDFSEEQLIDLFDRSESTNLLPEDRETIISFIEENLDKINIVNNSAWSTLRHILSHHRSYPDAEHVLDDKALQRYEQIYIRLEPKDSVERISWLFNEHWPLFPEGEKRHDLSYLEKLKLIQDKRIEALKTIYFQFGFERVKELARNVKEPWIYGDTLGFVIQDDREISSICEFLKEENKATVGCAQVFVSRKTHINGIGWLTELYKKLKKQNFPVYALARLFHRLEQNKEIWKVIEDTEEEIRQNYWKSILPQFWDIEPNDLHYGIDMLFEARRYLSVLDIAYHTVEKLNSTKLIEVLTNAATEKSDETAHFDSYKVGRLMEEAETRSDIEPSDLLRLEWLYLPILSSYGSNQKPDLLYNKLSQDPDFFVEILKWIYSSEIEEPTEDETLDELKRDRGIQGFRLLNSWETIPGVDDQGVIDMTFLTKWIDDARLKAEKIGRLKVADSHIGRVLAHYPEQSKPWPPSEICTILENIGTEAILNNFATSTFNKRGSSTRGAFDGGDIERNHASFFRAQATALKYDYPKVADVLNRLAEGYEADAKRMDDQAEMDKLDI